MGVRINTNIEALNAQRNLGATAAAFGKSVEKLSSGLRINRAADDAAGLAISEKLRAQVRGLNQAQRNAQDGISMVQTAEGALNEVHSMLQRMRELGVQASNSTLSQTDAQSVNTEIVALQAEINRVTGATTFNGQNLLTGSLSASQTGGTATVGLALATGAAATISAINVSAAKANTTYTITAAGAVLTLADGVGNSQAITASAIGASGSETLSWGTLGVSMTIVGAAAKTGANIGTDLTTLTVITGANAGANFQIGANASDSLAVGFANATTSAAGYGTLFTAGTGEVAVFTNAVNAAPATIVASAQALITSVDTALAFVSSSRGNFGAVQNRLEHTIASLGVASENLAASESRIRDLDVAAEMVNFTKTQILQQAGTAILAQANSAPQSILSLLK
jgi:flagellin